MSETMRIKEIKTTDDAILFLKQLPGFACYHRYFETKLAGDFAFELAKFISKREAEIEQMREALKSAEVVVDFYEANNNGAGRGIGKMIKAALAAERGG